MDRKRNVSNENRSLAGDPIFASRWFDYEGKMPSGRQNCDLAVVAYRLRKPPAEILSDSDLYQNWKHLR